LGYFNDEKVLSIALISTILLSAWSINISWWKSRG